MDNKLSHFHNQLGFTQSNISRKNSSRVRLLSEASRRDPKAHEAFARWLLSINDRDGSDKVQTNRGNRTSVPMMKPLHQVDMLTRRLRFDRQSPDANVLHCCRYQNHVERKGQTKTRECTNWQETPVFFYVLRRKVCPITLELVCFTWKDFLAPNVSSRPFSLFPQMY